MSAMVMVVLENTGNILEVVVMLVDSIITGSILINSIQVTLEK